MCEKTRHSIHCFIIQRVYHTCIFCVLINRQCTTLVFCVLIHRVCTTLVFSVFLFIESVPYLSFLCFNSQRVYHTCLFCVLIHRECTTLVFSVLKSPSWLHLRFHIPEMDVKTSNPLFPQFQNWEVWFLVSRVLTDLFWNRHLSAENRNEMVWQNHQCQAYGGN